MGIFGIGKEEVRSDSENKNEDIVKEVASEVGQSTLEKDNKEELVKDIPQESVINKEDDETRDKLEEISKIYSKSEKEKKATINAILNLAFTAIMLTSCASKSESNSKKIPFGGTESIPPEVLVDPSLSFKQTPSSMEYIGKEFLLNDPIRLNQRDFSIGVEGYPDAIIDRSMFATKENGEPLFLRYSGGQFNEVTYLHYTGERPYVVGEILPLMYKVPENIGDIDVEVVPYAISIQSEREKINFNDGKNHYLVPIVVSGSNSRIVDRFKNGEVVNSAEKPFEVKPDSISGSTKGYLSYAVLTEIGNELVMEGVIENNNSFFIDTNNIPEEISSLINE